MIFQDSALFNISVICALLFFGTITVIESASVQQSEEVTRFKAHDYLESAKIMLDSVNELEEVVYNGKLDKETKEYQKAIVNAIGEFASIVKGIDDKKLEVTKAEARTTAAYNAMVKAIKIYMQNGKMLDEFQKEINDEKSAGRNFEGEDPQEMLNELRAARDAILKAKN